MKAKTARSKSLKVRLTNTLNAITKASEEGYTYVHINLAVIDDKVIKHLISIGYTVTFMMHLDMYRIEW